MDPAVTREFGIVEARTGLAAPASLSLADHMGTALAIVLALASATMFGVLYLRPYNEELRARLRTDVGRGAVSNALGTFFGGLALAVLLGINVAIARQVDTGTVAWVAGISALASLVLSILILGSNFESPRRGWLLAPSLVLFLIVAVTAALSLVLLVTRVALLSP